MALFEQGEAALKAHDTARAYELFRQAAAHIERTGSRHGPTPAGPSAVAVGAVARPSRRSRRPGRPRRWPTRRRPSSRCSPGRSPPSWPTRNRTPAPCARPIPRAPWRCWRRRGRRSKRPAWTAATRDQLLRRVDRAIAETKQFIEQNRPQIELAEKNNRIRQDVDRQQRVKVEVGEKLAMMIDEFNKLMDEQRYAEAEVVAKQAAELDPDEPGRRAAALAGEVRPPLP